MKTLVQETFENEFNEVHYKEFVKNLFNHFDFSKEHTLKHQFNDAERQALNDFTYFGTYEDAAKKCLDVLTVQLKSSSKVERARSLQRNLIGKYLKTNLKDSALVAFYSKDNPDWRLSFVKMDYRLDERGVKVEIGTPPKRYSFLVGKTEPSHTAQKQLLPLLDDRKVPTLDEIEKSFSIEKVTKEFYTEIAKKFTELVGGERKIGSKKIIEAGQLKYPKPSDTLRKEFAVRLIGRLMFCWFLKKKKSDAGVSLIPNVILSSDAIMQYPDYYHNLLEPLFFQVLNTPIEKRNKSVRHSFWNNVPFLNGGLFEPHLYDYYEIYYESGLSKYINTLKVPDSWFLYLFKIFEIYNFTIDESTSIDIDISVDPEMLGRIFENLLAEINPQTGETARKSTGSYYTPRPIVEYMVDESLKQYLKTQIDNAPQPPLKLRGGEGGVMFPSPLEGEGKGEGESLDDKLSRLLSYGDYEIDLSEPEKDAIIDALDGAKIIDPACGSGAFPMGILHKMLLILQKIDPESKQWLSKKLARIDNEILRKELEKKLKTENWDYVHKLGIIQNSIYGVDIQPIAVEISKLRFFLSLIVDEKIDDDKPNRGVVPLPNLEFKFVAANSLIGLPHTMRLSQMELFEARDYIKSLRQLRDDYFASYGEDKRKIEQDFRQIQQKMFEYANKEMVTHKKTLETQTLKLSEWNPFSDEASSWFDPEWMFGVRDGFDITIGNPPYFNISTIDKDSLDYLSKHYPTIHTGYNDIVYYFIYLGIELLKKTGCCALITSNYYLGNEYAKKLRAYLKDHATKIINFKDHRVFDAASIHTCISISSKESQSDEITFFETTSDKQLTSNDIESEFRSFVIKRSDLNDNWIIADQSASSIINKLNKAAILLGNISTIKKGATSGNREIFTILKSFAEKNKFEKELLKTSINSKDIKRYLLVDSGEYLIYVDNNTNIKKYPNIYKYLLTYQKVLSKRNEVINEVYPWYRLERPREKEVFDAYEKIVVPYRAESNMFAYDNKQGFNDGGGSYAIVMKDDKINIKYVLALLNSKLIDWFYGFIGKPKGNAREYFNKPLALIPIKKIPLTDQQPFITIVDQILSIKQKDPNAGTTALERQIDKMVYELYDLTPKEIEVVEGRSR